MTDPVVLYPGVVVHRRVRPRAHRFRYRAFSILIDLDRLDEADRCCRLFSVGRFNLLSFHPSDHGNGDGTGLREAVDRMLVDAGCSVEGGRLLLLCYPRVLGFAFNPLAVYLRLAPDGALSGIVYEVRNTFGERHFYVVPGAGLRHEVAKAFHVSPFLAMEHRYRFRIEAPGSTFRLAIRVEDEKGPVLATAVLAWRRSLTAGSILSAFARVPFLAAAVLGGIHWEALKLWLKGLPVYPHPARARPRRPAVP